MKDVGYIYLNKLYVNQQLHCVYSGKHDYGGEGIDKKYWGSGLIWVRELKKYRLEDGSNVERIIIDKYNSREEADMKEIFWIAFIQERYGTLCVNLAPGGEGGNDYVICNKTEEEIKMMYKQISEKNKGMPGSFTGRHHTEETKQLLSNQKKGNIPWNKGMTGIYSGEKNPFFGKHHTEETKKINSEKHKKENLSPETLKKMKENHADVKGENNPSHGKHYFNNGVEERYESECPEGFVPGQLESHIKKAKENHNGMHWYNNGETQTQAYECPEGFVSGRLNFNNKGNTGMHWYTNGVDNELTYECPEGYHRGRTLDT